MAGRPPAARGGSVITEPRGARRPPARKHAAGPGTGKSGGEPQRSQPRHAPALEPPASRGAYARLSQGPMVCYSHRALAGLAGAYRTTRPAPTPGSPHIVCSGTTRTCKNRGPPPLPFWEGRRRIGRGGETPPPLPFWEGRRRIGRGGETPPPLSFSKALCGVHRPAPRVALAGGRAPGMGVADGRGTVEDGRGGRTGDSNPGCNYLVRGYSPSMHFFWGGDMPHYSPPLPFRRGRAGCPCLLASPPGRPARGSWTCALAGVPRPVPRAAAAYVRDGLRARPGAWRRGCGLAGCVACPGPRPGCGRVRARWPAGPRTARGSRTGAARLRTGGEDESARTGDSNPGCNYLVRGYSPSMHFFWGGDMPHYSPPLPFRRGRAGCPCLLASPARGSRTCVLAGVP